MAPVATARRGGHHCGAVRSHPAHQRFRADVLAKQPFVVTQNEVLDAQVMVEAAHRSAQKSGVSYALARSDDLAEYKALCARHGLFATA